MICFSKSGGCFSPKGLYVLNWFHRFKAEINGFLEQVWLVMFSVVELHGFVSKGSLLCYLSYLLLFFCWFFMRCSSRSAPHSSHTESDGCTFDSQLEHCLVIVFCKPFSFSPSAYFSLCKFLF